MEPLPLFYPYRFEAPEKARMDHDGHFALPEILTEEARMHLTESLTRIQEVPASGAKRAREFAAEHDANLASLIGHPQMLALARQVLGADIRYDHCVALNRPGGDGGASSHSHEYSEAEPARGFVRIFFYINGFTPDDGALKVVPGSHLYRDPAIQARTDADLRAGWLAGKRHPASGAPLEIETLSAPPGTVILMWTHAAHAVVGRRPGSDTRWTVVYAYRNPGAPSLARWISPEFERAHIPGTEGLMPLY